jgi:hypothetical protein
MIDQVDKIRPWTDLSTQGVRTSQFMAYFSRRIFFEKYARVQATDARVQVINAVCPGVDAVCARVCVCVCVRVCVC